MDHPAVEVRDLEKRYGAVTAVAGLSLTAGPGQVLAILGPNGAGKTTTVEMCEGYRRPDAGTVRVPGLDLVALAGALPPAVTVSEPRRGEYLVTVPGPVDPQLVAAVTAWCADKDVLAEELRVRRRSLEDVFLELTGHGLR